MCPALPLTAFAAGLSGGHRVGLEPTSIGFPIPQVFFGSNPYSSKSRKVATPTKHLLLCLRYHIFKDHNPPFTRFPPARGLTGNLLRGSLSSASTKKSLGSLPIACAHFTNRMTEKWCFFPLSISEMNAFEIPVASDTSSWVIWA